MEISARCGRIRASHVPEQFLPVFPVGGWSLGWSEVKPVTRSVLRSRPLSSGMTIPAPTFSSRDSNQAVKSSREALPSSWSLRRSTVATTTAASTPEGEPGHEISLERASRARLITGLERCV